MFKYVLWPPTGDDEDGDGASGAQLLRTKNEIVAPPPAKIEIETVEGDIGTMGKVHRPQTLSSFSVYLDSEIW